jgi:hypothetical protein
VRIHGTTKQQPLTRFRQVERGALLPLPAAPYDLAVWKQVLLHRDCHVVFEQAYYSAPYRLVGQHLWVRVGARTVEISTADHQVVATHDRATTPGERRTILAHLPPEKVPGLVLTREDCRVHAQAIGPATTAVVERLLAHRPEDRLRVAHRLLRLAQRYGTARLERACVRVETFGEGDYVSVKRILDAGMDGEALPVRSTAADPSPHYTFVRQAGEFVASVLGVGR